ncbi:hypothetical protein ACLB2K_072852 [Fragaria x ananassa]
MKADEADNHYWENLDEEEAHNILNIMDRAGRRLSSPNSEDSMHEATVCSSSSSPRAHPSISAVHFEKVKSPRQMDGGDGRVRGAPGCAAHPDTNSSVLGRLYDDMVEFLAEPRL